jgi:hypothetical protein
MFSNWVFTRPGAHNANSCLIYYQFSQYVSYGITYEMATAIVWGRTFMENANAKLTKEQVKFFREKALENLIKNNPRE